MPQPCCLRPAWACTVCRQGANARGWLGYAERDEQGQAGQGVWGWEGGLQWVGMSVGPAGGRRAGSAGGLLGHHGECMHTRLWWGVWLYVC